MALRDIHVVIRRASEGGVAGEHALKAEADGSCGESARVSERRG